MSKTLLGAAATAAAAALSLAPAAPASADIYGIDDPADVHHGVDLRAVQVHNGAKPLRITLFHTNLRRDPRTGAGGSVYIDTDPADKGPELVFAGGFFEGTDYQLLHTDGFGAKKWGKPVKGRYSMTVDYKADTVRMSMSRKALGDAGKVRIAVRVSGTRTDGTSKGLVDWLGQAHSFTPWIARG